jgi:DNA-binding beta-propeller fold protein YncE
MSTGCGSRILALAGAAVGLMFSASAQASTPGVLAQLTGPPGCFMEATSQDPDEGCTTGRALGDHMNGVDASPDGKNVYVANAETGEESDRGLPTSGGGVVVFGRGAGGELTQLPDAKACIATLGFEGCTSARAVGGAKDVAVSPDGKHVYVVTGDGVTVLKRSASDGSLTETPYDDGDTTACVSQDGSDDLDEQTCQDGRALADAKAVIVSPDGKNVYVAAVGDEGDHIVNGVAAFTRNADDGSLTQLTGADACITDETFDGDEIVTRGEPSTTCRDGRYMHEPTDLAISPDGHQVYVVISEGRPFTDCDGGKGCDHGPGAIVVLDRDGTDGALTQSDDPDGCLTRSSDYANFKPDGECREAIGLEDGIAIAVSPDGRSVYAASQGGSPTGSADPNRLTYPGALTSFARDAGGDLTQLPRPTGCVTHDGSDGEFDNEPDPVAPPCTDGSAMTEPSGIAISADGLTVYTANEDDSAVAAFSRNSTSGVLTQFPGRDGCIFDAPDHSYEMTTACADGRGLGEVSKLVAVGSNVYAVARGEVHTPSDELAARGEDQSREGAVLVFARTPPTSASPTPACVENGQATFTVSEAAGGGRTKFLHHRIDNGPSGRTATTSANPGVATLTLGPGTHVVEFWGEDENGLVEPDHHTATIKSGGCTAAAAPLSQSPARRCASRRTIAIRLARKALRGKKVRSASARIVGVNRKLRLRRSGRTFRMNVNLAGLQRGRFTIRITVKLTDGRTITGTRRYRTCTPKRPGGTPPL